MKLQSAPTASNSDSKVYAIAANWQNLRSALRMLTDLRYAFRLLSSAPGFTTVAVLVLALGIGGTASVFTLCRAVLMQPLPFADANRLIVVAERRGGSRDANIPVSGHEFMAWRERSKILEAVALHRPDFLHLTGSGEPEPIEVVRTSVDYFEVLRLQASLGRVFAAGEDDSGGARVVILSDAFWKRRFAADPDVLGRSVALNDQTFTIIGVLPPLPDSLSSDAWIPIDLPAHVRAVGRHNLGVLGRLAPNVSIEQAQVDLQAISTDLARQLPGANTDHNAHVASLRDSLVGDYRFALLLLLGSAGFVLLIACTNLANLLLTRGTGRQTEMVIRTAIGAGRFRLIRQLLAESTLIGLLGGAAGLLMAVWIVDLLPRLTTVEIPLLDTSRIDLTVVAVCAVLSLLTGAAIGVAPALRASRPDIRRFLTTGRGASDDPGGWRLRHALVASQVASTLVLLVGAGLMLNSFVRLLQVRPGFETENVAVIQIELPASRYPGAERTRVFYDEAIAKLQSVAGVRAVGAISHLPLGRADNWMPFVIQGRPAPQPGQDPYAAFRVATPDYFRALGIPLKAGRFFTDEDRRLAVPVVRWFPQQPRHPLADRSQSPPVALISETAALHFWPGEDPLGKRIRVLFSPEITVVGVVGDVKHNGLNRPASPHIYLPHSQEPWNSFSMVVRTSVPPPQVMPLLREQVRALDPNLPVTIHTLDEVRHGRMAEQRFYALLVGLFGFVALGLAVIGIFGVVSFTTVQRQTEIGVRLALGAQPREILALIIVQALPTIAGGVTVGLAGALALGRFVQSLLFEVRPADPLTFGAAVAVLIVVAIAACWIPARRAARLDPIVALRAH